MEAKAIVRAMIASMAVFFVWMALSQRMGWGPKPPSTQPAADRPAVTSPTLAQTGPADSTAPLFPAAGPAEPHPNAIAATDEQTRTLGSAIPDGPDRLRVELTNRGGGAIGQVQLADYKLHVDDDARYIVADVVQDATGREFYSWATESVRIGDVVHPLDELYWEVSDTAEGDVTYTITVPIRGEPRLKITKTLTLHEFDVGIELRVENLTSDPISATFVQRGPTGLARENLQTDGRLAIAASRTGGEVTVDEAGARADVLADPFFKTLFRQDPDNRKVRFVWAAVYNKYFTNTAAVITDPNDDTIVIDECRAVSLTGVESDSPPNDLSVQLITAPLLLAAGESRSLTFQAYFGPKADAVFELDAYRAFDYGKIMDYGFASCTFTSLARLMISTLRTFEGVTHNYGLAIIILVLIVRTLLHPITKKGQVNMMKMQKGMAALQPKMEELKTRYANDRPKLNTETMKLYKEQGVNPAGNILGCLPMFLQMPIWVALWTALGSMIEMRHAPLFTEGYWIKDLAGPDTLIAFGSGFHVPLLSVMMGEIQGLNILPFFLGLSMYLQQRYMSLQVKPSSMPGKSPDEMAQQQAMQKKMGVMMALMFPLMLYNAPSGLNLYIMTSTFFGVIEQKRIRKHIEDQEAAGTLLVKKKAPKASTGPTWFDRLQKKVEEAQRLESARKPAKKSRKTP